MQFKSAWCIILVIGLKLSLQSQIQNELPAGFTESDLKGASLSIHVMDYEQGNTLYAYDADRLLIPASIQKLLSTGAVMERFGLDYQFKTALGVCKPKSQSISKKSLIIYGSGDPSLGSHFFPDETARMFTEWTQAITRNGYNTFENGIVVDATATDWLIPDEWTWNDIGNYYGVPPGAINFFDNTCVLHYKTSAPYTKANVYKIEPDLPDTFLKIKPNIKIDTIQESLIAFGTPYETTRYLSGNLSPFQNDVTLKISMPHPAEVLAYSFQKHLKTKGLYTSGYRVMYESPFPCIADTFYFHLSPPLKTLIHKTLLYSINLYAEAFVLKMGNGKYHTGVETLNTFWKSKIPNYPAVLFDGSGLSRSNLVSAVFMTHALHYLLKSKFGSAFESTMAVSGLPGGLNNFAAHTALRNNLKGKSGYMSRVRSYAGIFNSKTNRKLVFCIIVNNSMAPSSRLKTAIEQFLVSQYLNH